MFNPGDIVRYKCSKLNYILRRNNKKIYLDGQLAVVITRTYMDPPNGYIFIEFIDKKIGMSMSAKINSLEGVLEF